MLNVEEVGATFLSSPCQVGATERKRKGKKCPTTEAIMGRIGRGMEGRSNVA